MVTARSRGKYYEKKSKEYYEKQGYKVEQAKAKLIWVKGRPITTSYDFFSLFDLICIKEDGIKLVQVKFLGEDGHGWLADVREKIKSFNAPTGSKELHIWKKEGNKVNLTIELI